MLKFVKFSEINFRESQKFVLTNTTTIDVSHLADVDRNMISSALSLKVAGTCYWTIVCKRTTDAIALELMFLTQKILLKDFEAELMSIDMESSSSLESMFIEPENLAQKRVSLKENINIHNQTLLDIKKLLDATSRSTEE